MANNLFVSYDLRQPGRDYTAAFAAIQRLRTAAPVHLSLWYVNSPFTAQQAFQQIWPAFDPNDRVMVIDATNNSAHWVNLDESDSTFVQYYWPR